MPGKTPREKTVEHHKMYEQIVKESWICGLYSSPFSHILGSTTQKGNS